MSKLGLQGVFERDMARTTAEGAPVGTLEDTARRLAALPPGAGFGKFRDTVASTQADTKEPFLRHAPCEDPAQN